MTLPEITNEFIPIDGTVSVIIPVYNGEGYLRRCLESLRTQDYSRLQIILINDGSTDSSDRICDAYAMRDKRFVVRHVENKGQSKARNCGIDLAEGEFLCFVDCDDYLDRNAIGSMVDAMKTKNVEIVSCNYIEDSHATGTKRVANKQNDSCFFSQQEIADELIKYMRRPGGYSTLVVAWGTLYRSSMIKENKLQFDNDVRVFEDIKFILECYTHVDRIYYLSDPIYNYFSANSRSSAGSIGLFNNPTSFKFAIRYIFDFILKFNLVDKIPPETMNHIMVSYAVRTIILAAKINGLKFVHKSRKQIKYIIDDHDLRMALGDYAPTDPNESRVIPLLIKHRLPLATLIVVLYKIYKSRSNMGL